MITGLLLLPVASILIWLYWYLLPERSWTWTDGIILVIILLLMAVYVRQITGVNFEDSGPMFVEIVSIVGAYAILLTGLGAALWWRRRQGKPSASRKL